MISLPLHSLIKVCQVFFSDKNAVFIFSLDVCNLIQFLPMKHDIKLDLISEVFSVHKFSTWLLPCRSYQSYSFAKLSLIWLLKFRSVFFVMSAQSHFCNLSSDTTDFKQLCISTGCLILSIKINLFILFSYLATLKPIISIIIYHS